MKRESAKTFGIIGTPPKKNQNYFTMTSMVARQQRTKGESFLAEADKELKKSTWFASSTEQKYENAAELLEKAGNAFKVGGFGDEAGNAYTRAAELHRDKLKNMGEASKCLTNAGMSPKEIGV